MVSYGNPVYKPSDLRGTYSTKGYKNLHIVGVADNEGAPARVLELRDHFLKSKAKLFGRFYGDITTVAIWDSTEMYGRDLASLHHVGENVFSGEWLKLFEAHGDFEAVLTPSSVSVASFIECKIVEGDKLSILSLTDPISSTHRPHGAFLEQSSMHTQTQMAY